MNIYKFLFAFGIITLFGSCFNYETQYEGPYSDSENTGGSFSKELVYVAGGKVFLADRFAESAITLDDSGSVTVASINNDHTKVLYKRVNNNIQIYDIATETVIDEVPDSENAKWFDFHPNNETVFFLSFNMLDTYGPDVLPTHPIDLGALSGVTGGIVYGVALAPSNRIYFSVASSSTNTEYLFYSNGLVILDFKVVSNIKSDFRLSPDYSTLWMARNQGSLDLEIVFTLGLNFNTILTDVAYGVPIAPETGYRATRQNTILTIENNTIEVLSGQITSIDF